MMHSGHLALKAVPPLFASNLRRLEYGAANEMPINLQILWLFVLSIPVASVAWTVTHEEVFREPREYCQRRCKDSRGVLQRKFFYLFTCEYCFSHYVAIFFLLLTRYKLLYTDWRGYLLALFALVWVSNIYMSIYNRLRLDIQSEKVELKVKEIDAVEKQKAA
jgi:hypothetical protein